jgi:hypothetical protein
MGPKPLESWPYYFCPTCDKLSPTIKTKDGDIQCVMCRLYILPRDAGRLVILSTEEAILRNLPVASDEEEE